LQKAFVTGELCTLRKTKKKKQPDDFIIDQQAYLIRLFI
jgi:hypothetical protein